MTVTVARDRIQRHIEGAGAPSAVEAERTLLGIVLSDPGAIDIIEGLQPAHFFEPLQGRLWGAIQQRHAQGSFSDPALLDGLFRGDEAYHVAGGLGWLLSLVETAPGASRAEAYATQIRESAQRRDLLRLADDMTSQIREGEASAADVIGSAEAALLAMQASSRRLELVTAGFAAARVLEWLDAPQDDEQGVRTGIAPLDEALGPLQPGNVVAMAGRTSMGKSAGAEVVAYNIAAAGYGVIQISTEMADAEMARRHLTDICHRHWGIRGPEYRDILRRRISHDQRQMLSRAQAELDAVPLAMLRRSGVKLSMVRSICRRQAAAWARSGIPLGAVFIDHMGHVRLDQPSRDRYADQTAISNATKELADELACPVFPLLQINRETEKRDDKRPGLSDIRDSGAWEQDADIVIGWYREAYYAQRQAEPKGGLPGSKEDLAWAEWDRARRSPIIEAIILKARAGPPMTVKLWGDVARNAIRGAAPEGDLL